MKEKGQMMDIEEITDQEEDIIIGKIEEIIKEIGIIMKIKAIENSKNIVEIVVQDQEEDIIMIGKITTIN